MESEIKEYTSEIETLFIQFMLSNHELFVRCSGILEDSYFDNNQNKHVITMMMSHFKDYASLPSVTQIKAVTGKDITLDQVMAAKEDKWFLKEIELFCRYKKLRDAILTSPGLLDKGRYGEVETIIKAAVQLALVKDLGTDYYSNPKERLEKLKEGKGQISTGWRDIDQKLYGGLNKGEITIFAGQSGAGKSLFLQNLGVNWATSGLNVVYLSLELSEQLCSARLDCMHTGFETREVLKNSEEVHMRVRASQQKSKGTFQIKQMPNGCTANDIRAYIKEYEIHKGVAVDAILVDYLDLMSPVSKQISVADHFVKDKYVTEELRNLAVELNLAMVSASQLNRGSYEEIEFDPSHIAGGISKVNTADNVIGIFTSPAMREQGRYQVQFMKTRSSSGVGSRVDLTFNCKSLRISDMDEDDIDEMQVNPKGIQDQLNRRSIIRSGESVDQETGEIIKIDKDKKPVDSLAGMNALRARLKR